MQLTEDWMTSELFSRSSSDLMLNLKLPVRILAGELCKNIRGLLERISKVHDDGCILSWMVIRLQSILIGPSIWKHLLLRVCQSVEAVVLDVDVCDFPHCFVSKWFTALWRLLAVGHLDARSVSRAVIGCSWNILFYLIVSSPATQTPVSQSHSVRGGTKSPIGLWSRRSENFWQFGE